MFSLYERMGENSGVTERGLVISDMFDSMRREGEGKKENTLFLAKLGNSEDLHFLSLPLSLSLHLMVFLPPFISTSVSSLLWPVPR